MLGYVVVANLQSKSAQAAPHLEALLCSQLLFFSMCLLQLLQLLLRLDSNLADVGIVLLCLFQLHLHLCQLLLEVVQLHTNCFSLCLGMLQQITFRWILFSVVHVAFASA